MADTAVTRRRPVSDVLRRLPALGEPADDVEPPCDGETLVALYRDLLTLRTFDERCVAFQRQGRIGTYAIGWGHEALQAGAIAAAQARDWVFPSYRESAIGLLRGLPATTVLAWWRGLSVGWWDPRPIRVAPVCIPIATHVPHAAGMAWGQRLSGDDACSLVFFGDGATSEGAFHEGVNFAAVMNAPLVLICNNNQWAISTPIERQTRAAMLADKAIGYGIPAVRVDGTDVLAVHEATSEALRRARSGGGPTFIEALSYRAAPHATADDASLYIDADAVRRAREHECVGRFERFLIETDRIDPDTCAAARRETDADVLAAMEEVEAMPPPDPTDVFDTIYANPPATLAADRAIMLRHGA